MLDQFLKDMWDILRLRYRNPEEYRYSPAVAAAVVLLLGVINAAGMSALFGNSTAAIVFAVLLTALKWRVLAHMMRAVLRRSGAGDLPLVWFTLLSEALMIPMLLVMYVPQLSPVGLFWQVWTFWVQAIGFMKMGNVSGWKVMLGYIAYFIGTLLAGTVLLLAFVQFGWLDAELLNQRLESIMGAAQ
ncbi:hypothetical protein [Bergeriella denitrificans]|uniref:Yip1 domain-containing protein n=1 Tax=Bergeriella denitrificans TaxID=494 RepID=A0A378UGY5_BERDE|nr:hypothetical protein [Bergeriella denitrificans]STZ75732.1 Uncharacterised protein [Bergeriella denitrificans]